MQTLVEENEVAPAANKDLNEVLQSIQDSHAVDYACPRNQLRFNYEEGAGYSIGLGDRYRFPTNRHFNKQLTQRCAPGLKAYSRHLHGTGRSCYATTSTVSLSVMKVTQWFAPLDEVNAFARAIMSDKYKVVDDKEVFDVALPIIGEQGDKFRTLGGNRTDMRTYAKFISRAPLLEVGKRTMYAGFSCQTVRTGSATFKAFIFDSFCENGCTFGNIGLFSAKFVHRGAALTTKFGVGLW